VLRQTRKHPKDANMTIRTWVFDRVHCRWTKRFLTPGQWRALPHISIVAAGLACGGSAPPPPLTPSIIPPTTTQYVPPPEFAYPPAWGYTPPSGDANGYGGNRGFYIPAALIPLGQVIEVPAGPSQVMKPGEKVLETVGEAGPTQAAVPSPRSTVPEPAPLAVIGFGILILGLVRYYRTAPPVEPDVRWRVWVMEER
jgi:hypothetical protein